MFKGKFITIEGGEGSGKSTQINVIKAWLEKHNIPYVLTREPGGSPLGEELRKILKNATYDFSEMAELYLFNAGRIEHIEKVIKPNLEKGITVVCDRYYDSTLAYQGVARGLGYEKVKNLCKLAIDGMEPDMTIWLDINPVDAFKRKGGADVGDRLEQTGLNFHENVYLGYKKSYFDHQNRIKRIDATQNLENVSKDVELELAKLFDQN